MMTCSHKRKHAYPWANCVVVELDLEDSHYVCRRKVTARESWLCGVSGGFVMTVALGLETISKSSQAWCVQ